MPGHAHSELRPTPAHQIVPGHEVAIRSPETTEHEFLTVLRTEPAGDAVRIVLETTYGEEHVLDIAREDRLDVVTALPE